MNHYSCVVRVYDEDVYVDTNTGDGFSRVLERIDPLLCKMASKTYMPGYRFDDIKQELCIIAIEGINSFNPKKKVKLSTFLHIHLRNKLVSKIRSVNKLSNDAFAWGSAASAACDCGGSILCVDKAVAQPVGRCEDCGKEYKNFYRKSREEILFTQINPKKDKNGDEYGSFQDSIGGDDALHGNRFSRIEYIDFVKSINSLKEFIDDKTAKIIELVCLEDYSIKDAASQVGLTGWAASMRLKKLARNPRTSRIIKEILSKEM